MKLTDRYQLTVWSWGSLKLNPKLVKNELNISREKAVKLRAFYEEKGYDVKSWPLTEEEEVAKRTK